MRRGFERLFAALDDLVGPAEPPARLHGDLWGGNLLCDDAGAPCLCDPAVYGGHREIDLAMMRLFGGFGARVVRRVRRGVAARRRATRRACRCTSSTPSWFT